MSALAASPQARSYVIAMTMIVGGYFVAVAEVLTFADAYFTVRRLFAEEGITPTRSTAFDIAWVATRSGLIIGLVVGTVGVFALSRARRRGAVRPRRAVLIVIALGFVLSVALSWTAIALEYFIF